MSIAEFIRENVLRERLKRAGCLVGLEALYVAPEAKQKKARTHKTREI